MNKKKLLSYIAAIFVLTTTSLVGCNNKSESEEEYVLVGYDSVDDMRNSINDLNKFVEELQKIEEKSTDKEEYDENLGLSNSGYEYIENLMLFLEAKEEKNTDKMEIYKNRLENNKTGNSLLKNKVIKKVFGEQFYYDMKGDDTSDLLTYSNGAITNSNYNDTESTIKKGNKEIPKWDLDFYRINFLDEEIEKVIAILFDCNYLYETEEKITINKDVFKRIINEEFCRAYVGEKEWKCKSTFNGGIEVFNVSDVVIYSKSNIERIGNVLVDECFDLINKSYGIKNGNILKKDSGIFVIEEIDDNNEVIFSDVLSGDNVILCYAVNDFIMNISSNEEFYSGEFYDIIVKMYNLIDEYKQIYNNSKELILKK